jgi:cytochrome c553
VGAAFPPLAGQPASYIKSQLQAWQAAKRPPGPLGLMGAIARRLTSADISALTNWFATLPGGGGK